MMTFRNPADPGHGPAPYRLANNPGDPARQDDGRDLDEIGKNENFIEQVPLELLEIRHHVLPDRERFDFCLASLDGSAAKNTHEIRAFASRFAAQRTAGTQFRHMVSNIAVTITGNRAAASAYLLVLISKDGNHHSLPTGRYACELIKEDSGQWRFSRRTVFHDHDYTLDGIGR